MWKIYRVENYLYIENLDTGLLIDGAAASFEFQKRLTTDTEYILLKNGNWVYRDEVFAIGDLVDGNDIPYTEQTFEAFKEQNTGKSNGGGSGEGLDDNHSGYNNVILGKTIDIKENKESIISLLNLDGVINLDGTLTIL